jgi:guanylate kinase
MIEKGILLPIAAPSGTGKTTVCHELLKKDPRFEFSVSCTTRFRRDSEVDGVDYYFISETNFKKYIQKGYLAEWQKVFNNYYGTLKSTLVDAISNQKYLLLDIDVNGALNIKKLYPVETINIFLMPPSYEELLRRLQLRGTESEATLAVRNARIPDEMNQAKYFDHIIVNNQLNDTVKKILELLK